MNPGKENKRMQDKRKNENVRSFCTSNVSPGSPGKHKSKLGFFMAVVCGIFCQVYEKNFYPLSLRENGCINF